MIPSFGRAIGNGLISISMRPPFNHRTGPLATVWVKVKWGLAPVIDDGKRDPSAQADVIGLYVIRLVTANHTLDE